MSKEVIDHRLKTVEMVEKLHKTIYNQDQKISELETKLADLQEEQTKEMQEHQEAMELADKTITNLVEDNRASQEWYKKQLADTEEQNKRVLEKLELIVRANQELEQKLAEKEKEILNLKNIVDGIDTLKQYDKDDKQIILINPDNVYADGHRLVVKNADQDKISFAVDVLEEIADCSNYINSKLDFECGSYVSEKAIRDKIKYLKGKKDE